MAQFQGQKWPLTTFLYLLGLLQSSYLGTNLENYLCASRRCRGSGQRNALCMSKPHSQHRKFTAFLPLPGPTEFFQTSDSFYFSCPSEKSLKGILTLDTTVINACAIRNGSVSGVPYSKQSFMRERPFFPQNRQT